MTFRKTRSLVLLFAAFAFALAACGGTLTASADDGPEDHVEAEADHVETEADHVETEAEAHDEGEANHDETDADHDDAEADHDETDADHDDAEADGGHAHESSFGSPADASDADRVIEVDANDDFSFGPAEIVVSAGETITFVVTNTGNLPHDFTLGDQHAQDEHAAEMAEMMAGGDMAHDDPNAVVVEPGETKELTWHFSETGTFIIGCHQPGHYAAGMVGSVDVEA
ncbi:MAG: plastocyanin/azurin family copper-binding protein [Acidimicrobiia bacterium]